MLNGLAMQDKGRIIVLVGMVWFMFKVLREQGDVVVTSSL